MLRVTDWLGLLEEGRHNLELSNLLWAVEGIVKSEHDLVLQNGLPPLNGRLSLYLGGGLLDGPW